MKVANVAIWDTGTTYLGPNQDHSWDIRWYFAHNTWIWVTAQPNVNQKDTSVEVVHQHNYMDMAGEVVHNYIVKNTGSKWMECREMCVKIWP